MADMTAKQEQLCSSYKPHQRRVTQQCVYEIWVSTTSERDRQYRCGQCGRDESQGQTKTAFQGRKKEEKFRVSEIKVK